MNKLYTRKRRSGQIKVEKTAVTGPAGVTQAAWVVHEGMCAKPWKMVMWGWAFGWTKETWKEPGRNRKER